jgi:cation diffusion facilitator CzcD-associated flavoprotein CzcO
VIKYDHEVVVIGAGPGGVAAAHDLLKNGITDFVILERRDDFGGTWRDNHYPGLEVDIPSIWYQFSFARKPDWSRLFAPGPEINQYIRSVARDLGLYDRLRTGAEVLREVWDDQLCVWRLEMKDNSTITTRYVISAVGAYRNTKETLTIDGVQDFRGVIMRPNNWDNTYDVADKRIAVIGTGSSGVQIAGAVAAVSRTLDVYQRTPSWVLPKVDFDLPPAVHFLFRMPGVMALLNIIGRWMFDIALVGPLVHLLPRLPDKTLIAVMPFYDMWCRTLYRLLVRFVVRDREARKALVPTYGILAKRPVVSSRYMPIFNKATTNLVTAPIKRITPTGIETVDGIERPADIIVMATGYEVFTDPETYRPNTVVGREGFDLAQYYQREGLRSYAGTCHPDLPNRWDITSPIGFTGLAWFDYLETNVRHAVRIIAESRRRSSRTVSVRGSVFAEWNLRMQRQGKAIRLYTIDCNPGLSTYFINSQNEVVYWRPEMITTARRFSRSSPLTDYEFARRSQSGTYVRSDARATPA